MSKQKRKPKKAKEPFWKQFSPEVKSISDHLGKMADNTKANDWVDLTLMGSLAYLGYEISGSWKGALVGPVALKLATSPNEIAAASGVIGLVGLGVIAGVPSLIPGIENIFNPTAGKTEIDSKSIAELEAFLANPPLGAKIHPVIIFYAETVLQQKRNEAAAASIAAQAAERSRLGIPWGIGAPLLP